MRITGMALLIFLAVIGQPVYAQYKMGIGARFSNDDPVINNSISFKYFLNDQTAAEAMLSFGGPVALGLLLEKHQKFISKNFRWFYGGGAYLGAGQGKYLGVQGIIGLDYKLPLLPVNLSIDWKPELNLVRAVVMEASALGVSARFTFK